MDGDCERFPRAVGLGTARRRPPALEGKTQVSERNTPYSSVLTPGVAIGTEGIPGRSRFAVPLEVCICRC